MSAWKVPQLALFELADLSQPGSLSRAPSLETPTVLYAQSGAFCVCHLADLTWALRILPGLRFVTSCRGVRHDVERDQAVGDGGDRQAKPEGPSCYLVKYLAGADVEAQAARL